MLHVKMIQITNVVLPIGDHNVCLHEYRAVPGLFQQVSSGPRHWRKFPFPDISVLCASFHHC